MIGRVGNELEMFQMAERKKSAFLCKSDGYLVLVDCHESFKTVRRRHCDPDLTPLSTKLGGMQTFNFCLLRERFASQANVGPFSPSRCYCLCFNNDGVAVNFLRLTALSDNHKQLCVRLKSSLSAKLLIAAGGWSYYD